MERAIIIGATSSLGYALIRALAAQGADLVLCGRDEAELVRLKQDIAVRYSVRVALILCDLGAEDFTASVTLEKAEQALGECDSLLMLAGDMGNPLEQEKEENIERVTRVNYTNPAKLLATVAERMATRGKGSLVVISSVAGDRGRQSNYVYGSAKAALTSFASGLRNKYAGKGVHVMTVKPGFVDTPLTYSMESPLIASRDGVAQAILRGLALRRNIFYVPWFWWGIMLIIQHIPEAIFKRMRL